MHAHNTETLFRFFLLGVAWDARGCGRETHLQLPVKLKLR